MTVFALFYFVFEGNFQVQAPGGLIFGGAISRRVFCVTSLAGGGGGGGLIPGGAYFRKFTVVLAWDSNMAEYQQFQKRIY